MAVQGRHAIFEIFPRIRCNRCFNNRISGQSVESHKKFAENYSLKYPLLSDDGDRVRKLFGFLQIFSGFYRAA